MQRKWKETFLTAESVSSRQFAPRILHIVGKAKVDDQVVDPWF